MCGVQPTTRFGLRGTSSRRIVQQHLPSELLVGTLPGLWSRYGRAGVHDDAPHARSRRARGSGPLHLSQPDEPVCPRWADMPGRQLFTALCAPSPTRGQAHRVSNVNLGAKAAFDRSPKRLHVALLWRAISSRANGEAAYAVRGDGLIAQTSLESHYVDLKRHGIWTDVRTTTHVRADARRPPNRRRG